MRGVDDLEVAEGGGHACRVGIVGINDESVVGCDGELAAVVGWGIFGQCCADVVGRYAEECADAGCSKGVVKVVAAYEFGLHFVGQIR